MMKTKVMVVSLLALLAGYGLADTVDWTGESGASYTDAANWTVRGTEENLSIRMSSSSRRAWA